MTRLARSLLHRAWLPAVLAITLAAFAPRVAATIRDSNTQSHAAGVYGWEQAPPSDAGDVAFRWTRGRAAVREPLRGRTMIVPLFLARPDMADTPVSVRVSIDGVLAGHVTLTKNGWRLLSYDLVDLLGARGRSLRSVTLRLDVSPVVVPARLGNSDDQRELGIGVGAIRWSGPSPDASSGSR